MDVSAVEDGAALRCEGSAFLGIEDGGSWLQGRSGIGGMLNLWLFATNVAFQVPYGDSVQGWMGGHGLFQ